jgi:hypothetical protein
MTPDGAHPPAGARPRRPVSVSLLVVVLAFQAVSALAGGAAMLIAPRGGVFPIGMLAGSPFETFLIPGALLFVVLGALPAVVAWALIARPGWCALAPVERAFGTHWSWPAAGAVGVALLVFLGVELAMIGPAWLQAVYGVVGASIVGLALVPDTRDHYRR